MPADTSRDSGWPPRPAPSRPIPIAIKVLPEHIAARPSSRQRFERDAKIIVALNHPHICQIFDVGHQDAIEYLVMEYVEGETLALRLKRGPLPLEQMLRYGIQIVEALDQAHRREVIHRDLKPGNIILTKDGVKVLDFGLSKTREPASTPASDDPSTFSTETSPLTGAAVTVGTLPYIAPEQLEGKEADARSDVFPFGAVLYEMLTAHKAFEAKSHAGMIAAEQHPAGRGSTSGGNWQIARAATPSHTGSPKPYSVLCSDPVFRLRARTGTGGYHNVRPQPLRRFFTTFEIQRTAQTRPDKQNSDVGVEHRSALASAHKHLDQMCLCLACVHSPAVPRERGNDGPNRPAVVWG